MGCGADDHVEVDLGDQHAMPRAIAEIKERLGGLPLHALDQQRGLFSED